MTPKVKLHSPFANLRLLSTCISVQLAFLPLSGSKRLEGKAQGRPGPEIPVDHTISISLFVKEPPNWAKNDPFGL